MLKMTSKDLNVVKKENENLMDYISSIAKEINFGTLSASNTPTVERIPVKNKTTGKMMQSNTILIHFPVVRQKQMFYSCYLNKMPLDPVKFNLPEDNRITLGENLTRINAQVFKAAQNMKKNKRIAQTFTEDGTVRIRLKKGKNETAHIVRSITELEVLVAKHETVHASGNGTTVKKNATNTMACQAESNAHNITIDSGINDNNSRIDTHTSKSHPAELIDVNLAPQVIINTDASEMDTIKSNTK